MAGDAATILLAVGLIGAGLLAVPVLTGSAAYGVSEALGWRYGLGKHPRQAKQFYGVIAAATLVGMLINYAGINPITALFWTAIINGLIAPPLLVLIMLVVNNREVMGDRVNNLGTNAVGWITAIAMFAAMIGLIASWIVG